MTVKKMDNIIDYYVSELNMKSSSGKRGNNTYKIINGRKYAKVVSTFDGESHTVYCFIDRNTGDIYKPATWNSPAKIIRYTITDTPSAITIADKSDAYGNFLYMR